MALLITAFAAFITANIWYCTGFNNSKMLGILYVIYTAAAIIMFVINEVKYLTGNLACFTADFVNILTSACLGFFVVIFGLIIWLIVIHIKYSKNKAKAASKDLIGGKESE